MCDLHQRPEHPLPDVQGHRTLQVTPLLRTQAVGIEGFGVSATMECSLLVYSGTPFVD